MSANQLPHQMILYDSMVKYNSPFTVLEVIRTSHSSQAYLNRQIILLLNALGVKEHVFLELQKEYVQNLESVSFNKITATEFLRSNTSHHKHSFLAFTYKMIVNDFPMTDPFISGILRTIQAACVRSIQTRARIPVKHAVNVIGVLDELTVLKDGQVFLQTGGEVVLGKVVVTRFPCLYPGDIRVLEAVDKPGLHHLHEVVVFPAVGKRPHPSQMSGM